MRFANFMPGFAATALNPQAMVAPIPDPPTPEPIDVTELPMPPVTTGSCTPTINPQGTGCIGQGMQGEGFQSGSFLPDGRHIVAFVTFTGAPEAPDPVNIYEGGQIILIKTDGTFFPNGDPWKCVTCGVPAGNALGRSSGWYDSEPLVPRYDLANVTTLYNPNNTPPFTVSGDQLVSNPLSNYVGELRGFSGRGSEVTYIGYPTESCNIDVYAVELATGAVRRLTAHPEYVDPVDISPDDQWTAVMDTRGSDRQMFIAGMRGIPPLIDLIATSVASSTRNNHQRRFFQPYLIDRYGDRGSYSSQRINAAGSSVPGSGAINDPEWNGRADPKWSPDGTQVVYWQDLTASPACGGTNPLPCYNSTYPGGRFVRFMLATFTSRVPNILPDVEPISDTVPWGTPYVPGNVMTSAPRPPQGTYTFKGKASGSAKVVIKDNINGTSINSVAVRYTDYSDDGSNVINGYENFTRTNPSPSLEIADWYSDLVRTGETYSTKKTSPDGFHLSLDIFTNIFEADGTLTTTIDGKVYLQPANGT